MPFNLIKIYNQLLELDLLAPHERIRSLKGVFKRDFEEKAQLCFRGKPIFPIHSDPTAFEVLFNHLTTEITDKALRKREYEVKRSKRLHWARHHIEETLPGKISIFSVNDPAGVRTYIYDNSEQYVIILSPQTLSATNRNLAVYYLITAYYVDQRNVQKMKSKFNRKLDQVY